MVPAALKTWPNLAIGQVSQRKRGTCKKTHKSLTCINTTNGLSCVLELFQKTGSDLAIGQDGQVFSLPQQCP